MELFAGCGIYIYEKKFWEEGEKGKKHGKEI